MERRQGVLPCGEGEIGVGCGGEGGGVLAGGAEEVEESSL